MHYEVYASSDPILSVQSGFLSGRDHALRDLMHDIWPYALWEFGCIVGMSTGNYTVGTDAEHGDKFDFRIISPSDGTSTQRQPRTRGILKTLPRYRHPSIAYPSYLEGLLKVYPCPEELEGAFAAIVHTGKSFFSVPQTMHIPTSWPFGASVDMKDMWTNYVVVFIEVGLKPRKSKCQIATMNYCDINSQLSALSRRECVLPSFPEDISICGE